MSVEKRSLKVGEVGRGVGLPIQSLLSIRDPEIGPGEALGRIPGAAESFRKEFVSTGVPESIDTVDLMTLPYPTRFGLWRAASSPAPFLAITNRMLVIRWSESDGTPRTLLFEPSDIDLGANTPYFADLASRLPNAITSRLTVKHLDVVTHLATLGIHPREVDYLVFDHLHTQDVRRWLGTTESQPDLNPDGPVKPIFPNAKLIAQRRELSELASLHPTQRRWYQPETFRALPPDSIAAIDGDVLLGPGVAIIETPGHVTGNQSLVLNTNTGIWTSSENAIAVECLEPRHSRIPGVARWAKTWGQDVIVNANTLEGLADQYNSLMLEKALADRSQRDSRFVQYFPSSELTARWTNPGTSPTFSHLEIKHRRSDLQPAV